jgi:hypothetical protein
MSGLPGIKLSANGTSAPTFINPINQMNNYFPYFPSPSWSLGLVLTISGSLTATVQVTCDPQPTAGGNWNSHDILVSQTSSSNSNVAFPVTAVRLVVSGYSNGFANLGIGMWP